MQRFALRLLPLLVSLCSVSISTAQQTEVTSAPPLSLHWGSLDYDGEPWVRQTSAPYIPKGVLTGRHLYISASHGHYFNGKDWKWQRPLLYGTTEDMLTPSFVYPFLIPILENTGAVVYSPRERDPSPYEAVVDNDFSTGEGKYLEQNTTLSVWKDHDRPAFRMPAANIDDNVQPFQNGTARCIKTCRIGEQVATAQWLPQIMKRGRYAVYVSYAEIPNAVPDAHYIVKHAGGETHFSVNQQMGSGTWVYLGTFLFDEGQSLKNAVVLCNDSQHEGMISADGVRFGGGMGFTARSQAKILNARQRRDLVSPFIYEHGITSGLPRYWEAARYYAQYAGLPDSLYNGLLKNWREQQRGNNISNSSTLDAEGNDKIDSLQSTITSKEDYKDDIRTRSHLLNYLAGGSVFLPDTTGKRVPFELALALHTDAGFNIDGSTYGSLGIVTSVGNDSSTIFRSKLSRTTSITYAETMLGALTQELSFRFGKKWALRGIKDDNYGETRSPQIPSMILELLSHQNFGDMKMAHDPNFKFYAARAIYKAILHYIAQMHGIDKVVVQPLPVKNFALQLNTEENEVTLSWKSTTDELEASAKPDNYIVYSAIAGQDWDEGRLTRGKTNITLPITPGIQYIYKVCALNEGGRSFPSEILTAYCSKNTEGKSREILLVNAFNRLSGPARIETSDSLGFDLNEDIGVAWYSTSAWAGAQQNFKRSAMGLSNEERALGYSGQEWVGKSIAGNQFDGVVTHGEAIVQSQTDCSFSSISQDAFAELSPRQLKKIAAIDYICGLQREVSYNLFPYKTFPEKIQKLLTTYRQKGGNLLANGSFIGSDMQANSEKNFLRSTFRIFYRGQVKHTPNASFYGLGQLFTVYSQPNEIHFACNKTDVIEPTDGAFSAFSYGEGGYCAGVAFAGQSTNRARTIAVSFPIECIQSQEKRAAIMGGLLRFLLKDFKTKQ